MPVRRKTHEQLRARYQAELAERAEAQRAVERLEQERDEARHARDELRLKLLDAEAGLKRVDSRNQRLVELLCAAGTRRDAEAQLLERRLARLLRACVRYRQELARERRPRPAAPRGRGVHVLERRCRELAQQLVDAQRANEALTKELADMRLVGGERVALRGEEAET